MLAVLYDQNKQQFNVYQQTNKLFTIEEQLGLNNIVRVIHGFYLPVHFTSLWVKG
jgi:hypothetical protein